eukprot:s3464_g4.t1
MNGPIEPAKPTPRALFSLLKATEPKLRALGAMGSAAASASRRFGGSSVVKGSRICDDLELQELLLGWERIGLTLSGVILQAEHKETVKEYDMASDSWTATDTILGENQLVVKTVGDGLLTLRLSAGGFKWEHVGSYRLGGKSKDGQSLLKVVDSSTKDYKAQTRRNLLRQEVVACLQDMDDMTAEWEWEAEEEAEWEEEDWFEDLDSFSDISFSSCRTPSTTASSCDHPCEPMHGERSKVSKRWDEAIGRADVMAKLYTKPTQSGEKREPKSNEKKVPDKLKMLAGSLRNKHNVKLLEQSLADGRQDSLQSFQMEFLEQFSPAICSGLRGIFRNEIMLRATPTNKSVYDRFRSQIQKKGNELCPVFHGTDEANLPSIYAKGLLVPGGEQGVRVLHGASHGNGIYTAKTQNPGLAFGFCRGSTRPILVCGVLDDAVPLARKYLLGNHYVTAESQHARHVGDAIVVFDEGRVIPLFEAWDPGLHSTEPVVAAAALPPPAVQPRLPASLPEAKVYKGGPKTRLRSKPATREERVIAFLRRRDTAHQVRQTVGLCALRRVRAEAFREAGRPSLRGATRPGPPQGGGAARCQEQQRSAMAVAIGRGPPCDGATVDLSSWPAC